MFNAHLPRVGALFVLLGLGVAAQAQEGPRVYAGITAGVAAVIARDHDTDRHETGSGRLFAS